MSMFTQCRSLQPWKDAGAKWAVAVRQEIACSSEEWAQHVQNRLMFLPGLHTIWPGGDTWDNPSICIYFTNDYKAVEEVRRKFPNSEVKEL